MLKIKKQIKFIFQIIERLPSQSKICFYFGLIVYCLGSLISLTFPLILKDWINENLKNINYIYLLLIVSFLSVCISNAAKFFLNSSGFDLVKITRNAYFDKIIDSEISTIDKFSSGHLSSRITNDISLYFKLISSTVPSIIVTIFKIIFTLSILITLNYKLTFLGLSSVPFILLVLFIFQNKIATLSYLKQQKISNISSNFIQVKNNIKLAKAYNAESQEKINNSYFTKKAQEVSHQLSIIELIVPVFLIGISIISLFFIIKSGFSQINAKTLSMGGFIAFLLYLFQLLDPITEISILFSEVFSINGAVAEIEKILGCPISKKSTEKLIKLNSDIQEIEFKNVSFSYDDKKIFSNVSFKLRKGSIYTIVGPSGIGKSTLFSLILKFHDNYDGDIYINKINIKQIETTSLRHKISYIPQENLLFSRSIKENLFYGEDNYQNHEKYNFVKEKSQLTFLKNYNDLNRILSENGNDLSEGQKQRLAIARGLLKDSNFILLDESTSHLDPISEKIILDNLVEIKKDAFILMISHKKEAIKLSDYIIFLNNNKIIEGSHEKLLVQSEDYYNFINS
ncbi:ABC transporter ATP-binding protein [Streptococcus pluranimalium]